MPGREKRPGSLGGRRARVWRVGTRHGERVERSEYLEGEGVPLAVRHLEVSAEAIHRAERARVGQAREIAGDADEV